jgi:hypothetical protein
MVELDGAVEVTGVDGPVPFVDLFQGRDELVVYKHMWYDLGPVGRGGSGPARHDALRPRRDVGGQPGGLARDRRCREGHPSEGRQACWYWRSDADGVATWGPTSRPVPQWTRPGATPVETLVAVALLISDAGELQFELVDTRLKYVSTVLDGQFACQQAQFDQQIVTNQALARVESLLAKEPLDDE